MRAEHFGYTVVANQSPFTLLWYYRLYCGEEYKETGSGYCDELEAFAAGCDRAVELAVTE